MASDFTKQPLFPGSVEPLIQPLAKRAHKKRRFRRCRSAPSVDLLTDSQAASTTFPDSRFVPAKQLGLGQISILLVVYLGVGTTAFFLIKQHIMGKKTNGIVDSLYFCIVTMTTVGYGDLVPGSVSAKLLACAFVFSGMAMVGLLLSKAADYLVQKQEILLVRALHLRNKAGEMKTLKVMETDRMKYRFLTTSVLLLVLFIIGIIFLQKVEKLSFLDAFYCVCSTITTLGYGDHSFSTLTGRVFAIFWILTSTVCLAQFFLYLAEWNTEHRQRLLAKWVLNRRMTFVDLEAADIDEDGSVGAAEFIIYKLKEMGKITQEDISLVMEEFEDLDVDQSGTLSAGDLVLAQSSG